MERGIEAAFGDGHAVAPVPIGDGANPDRGDIAGSREPGTITTEALQTAGARPALRTDRPRRRALSLAGRAAPHLYAASWGLTALGLVTVALLLTGSVRLSSSGEALVVGSGAIAILGLGPFAGAVSQARQRRADEWAGYAGPSPFLVFVALWILSVAAVLLVLGTPLAVAGAGDADPSTELLLDMIVQLAMYGLIVWLLVVRIRALSWAEILRPRDLRSPREPDVGPAAASTSPSLEHSSLKMDVISGLLLVPVAFVGAMLVAVVLVPMLGLTHVEGPLPTPTTGIDRLLDLLTVALIAPAGEELFFRGFATNAWARTMGYRRAIIRSALFFSFIHVIGLGGSDAVDVLKQAVLAFGVRLPVSLALAWVYLRRRSIYASGTLHASYNAVAILISWLGAAG